MKALAKHPRGLQKYHEEAVRSARIEAGDYGYCDETGEPIGLARLLARPTTVYSIEAQERHERRDLFGPDEAADGRDARRPPRPTHGE